MNSIAQNRRSHLLVVEDSPHYFRLLQLAFREINPSVDLHIAHDGAEAMAFLRHDPRPDMILLDLNLPKMNGCELLACIKDDNDLKTIPTIIMAGSESEDDIMKCYELRANCYLGKPLKWDDFAGLMASLNSLWLSPACRLPGGTSANPLREMQS